MSQEAILVPMLAMVGLTFLVWARMYHLRIVHIVSGKLDPDKYKLKSAYGDVPDKVMYPSENLINLFELPVLFYAVVLSIYITKSTDGVFVVLAWAYVGLRYVHSFIHISYNRVVHRFTAYFVSSLILWFIWARLAYAVLTGSS